MSEAADALRRVTAALPGGGETRTGQEAMAEAVAEALATGRHLVVQAGTGTGKTLAYLVPAALHGGRVVVSTTTKALQDQLATKDLPFLEEAAAPLLGRPLAWAVLKGRSNYVCLQRLREATVEQDGRLELDDLAPIHREQVRRIARWAATSATGDQAELDWSPSATAWEAVSVTSEQCPGATRCPLGDPCFAEAARRRAAEADVVVVNTHLYGLDVAAGGMVLGDHDVVVLDEAHALEDTIASTAGLAFSGGRLAHLAGLARRILDDDRLLVDLAAAGDDLAGALRRRHDERLSIPLPDDVLDALAASRRTLGRLLDALRAIDPPVVDAQQRKIRAQKAATSVADDLDRATTLDDGVVAWVEGPDHAPRLVVAPIDVGPVLAAGVWDKRTAVLTSATIPTGLPARVGLPADRVDELDVGSPFDFEAAGLLYCATHLPDPRRPEAPAALHDELEALILAAGGRTLALFTSWKAMRTAAEALRPRLAYRVLSQDELPKPALIAAFTADETSCLFATAGLFQGIDVPGDALRLVTVDRIPFPRPDDPLLQARRERAGADAFRLVDLPRAATLLAQAAGRLIRSSTDRGVVAVLDPRLATAGYRWDVVRALPPLRRTRHRSEVEAFLRSLG